MNIELTTHAMGILIREMVRRVVTFVRNERLTFELTRKMGYGGTMDDVFTSADTGAQKLYIHAIEECFPGISIIGEEGEHNQDFDCVNDYFTLDPVDGTKAFVRKQSHGVSTMIALVSNNKVISAYIGDISTQEMYGYRPGSDKVHRISEYNIPEPLTHTHTPPKDQVILLRESPEYSSPRTQELVKKFKKVLVDGSSIGTWMARLWKGEVTAVVIDAGYDTPWDTTPIVGISEKLGYFFLKPNKTGWEEYHPPLVKEVVKRDHEILVIHPNDYRRFCG